MSVPNTFPSSSRLNPALQDSLGKRIGWALLASLLANLLLWRSVAAMARHPIHFDPKPVEITRVVLQPDGKRIEKVIQKEQIQKKLVQVHKEIAKRPTLIHQRQPLLKPPPVEPRPVPNRSARSEPAPKPFTPAPPPPETAHNRVLTAPDNKTAPAPTDHVVQAGGNADVGKPMNQQGTGAAKTNPEEIVKKDVPKPQPPPEMPKADVPRSIPKPESPADTGTKPVPIESKPEPKPEPKPDPSPKKKGPTREAEPEEQTKPEIPDDLKHGDFKSFVRVQVDIEADGSFSVKLRTSSGNPEIDNRVLSALQKWKWRPAMKNGEAISSTQRFKFEFLVE